MRMAISKTRAPLLLLIAVVALACIGEVVAGSAHASSKDASTLVAYSNVDEIAHKKKWYGQGKSPYFTSIDLVLENRGDQAVSLRNIDVHFFLGEIAGSAGKYDAYVWHASNEDSGGMDFKKNIKVSFTECMEGLSWSEEPGSRVRMDVQFDSGVLSPASNQTLVRMRLTKRTWPREPLDDTPPWSQLYESANVTGDASFSLMDSNKTQMVHFRPNERIAIKHHKDGMVWGRYPSLYNDSRIDLCSSGVRSPSTAFPVRNYARDMADIESEHGVRRLLREVIPGYAPTYEAGGVSVLSCEEAFSPPVLKFDSNFEAFLPQMQYVKLSVENVGELPANLDGLTIPFPYRQSAFIDFSTNQNIADASPTLNLTTSCTNPIVIGAVEKVDLCNYIDIAVLEDQFLLTFQNYTLCPKCQIDGISDAISLFAVYDKNWQKVDIDVSQRGARCSSSGANALAPKSLTNYLMFSGIPDQVDSAEVTCNEERNAQYNATILSVSGLKANSASQCCDLCHNVPSCNVWSWCDATLGCPLGEENACKLMYGENREPQVLSRGKYTPWTSGYLGEMNNQMTYSGMFETCTSEVIYIDRSCKNDFINDANVVLECCDDIARMNNMCLCNLDFGYEMSRMQMSLQNYASSQCKLSPCEGMPSSTSMYQEAPLIDIQAKSSTFLPEQEFLSGIPESNYPFATELDVSQSNCDTEKVKSDLFMDTNENYSNLLLKGSLTNVMPHSVLLGNFTIPIFFSRGVKGYNGRWYRANPDEFVVQCTDVVVSGERNHDTGHMNYPTAVSCSNIKVKITDDGILFTPYGINLCSGCSLNGILGEPIWEIRHENNYQLDFIHFKAALTSNGPIIGKPFCTNVDDINGLAPKMAVSEGILRGPSTVNTAEDLLLGKPTIVDDYPVGVPETQQPIVINMPEQQNAFQSWNPWNPFRPLPHQTVMHHTTRIQNLPPNQAGSILGTFPPLHASQIMQNLPPEYNAQVLNSMPPDVSNQILTELQKATPVGLPESQPMVHDAMALSFGVNPAQLAMLPPDQAATLLQQLYPRQAAAALRGLSSQQAAGILQAMPPADAAQIADAMPGSAVADILSEMQPVAGSQLLGSMSPVVSASALQQLDPSQSQAMLNLVDGQQATQMQNAMPPASVNPAQLAMLPPDQAATLLQQLYPRQAAAALRGLSSQQAAGILQAMPPADAAQIADAMPGSAVADILSEMQPVAGSQLLGSMSPVVSASALQQLDPSQSQAMLNLVDGQQATQMQNAMPPASVNPAQLAMLPPDQAATLLQQLYPRQAAAALRGLSSQQAAGILQAMPPADAAQIADAMPGSAVADILSEMQPVAGSQLLGSMSPVVSASALQQLDPSQSQAMLNLVDGQQATQMQNAMPPASVNPAQLAMLPPDQAATLLQQLYPRQAAAALRGLSSQQAAGILQAMPPADAAQIADAMPGSAVADILSEMQPVAGSQLLGSMSPVVSASALQQLDPSQSQAMLNLVDGQQATQMQNAMPPASVNPAQLAMLPPDQAATLLQQLYPRQAAAALRGLSSQQAAGILQAMPPADAAQIADAMPGSAVADILSEMQPVAGSQLLGSMSPVVSASALQQLDPSQSQAMLNLVDGQQATQMQNAMPPASVNPAQLAMLPPDQAATLLQQLYPRQAAAALRGLSSQQAAGILQAMPPADAAQIADAMPGSAVADILSEMQPVAGSQLLGSMSPVVSASALQQLDPSQSQAMLNLVDGQQATQMQNAMPPASVNPAQLAMLPPDQAATLLQQLYPRQAAAALRGLSSQQAAGILQAMPPADAAQIADAMPGSAVADILSEMQPVAGSQLLGSMSPVVSASALQQLDPSQSQAMLNLVDGQQATQMQNAMPPASVNPAQLAMLPPDQAATLLQQLYPRQAAAALRGLSSQQAAGILQAMPPADAAQIADAMPGSAVADILSEMQPVAGSQLLGSMSPVVSASALQQLDPSQSQAMLNLVDGQQATQMQNAMPPASVNPAQLAMLPPDQAATLLQQLYPRQAAAALRGLSSQQAAGILQAMPPADAAQIADAMPGSAVADILSEMQPVAGSQLLGSMSPVVSASALQQLDPSQSQAMLNLVDGQQATQMQNAMPPASVNPAQLAMLPPDQAATLLQQLYPRQAAAALRGLSSQQAAGILQAMPPADAAQIADAMPGSAVADILSEMQPVAGSQLLGSMSPVVSASALQQLDPSQSQAMLNLGEQATATNLIGQGGMNDQVYTDVSGIGMADLSVLGENELLSWMDSLSADELAQLMGSTKFVELIETLVRTNKAKMAVDILSRVPPDVSSGIFRSMDTLLVAELVQFMHPIEATVALGSMENESIANVFTLLPESVLNSILLRLPVSQIADVFDHMDSPKVAHYLVSEEHSLNVADVVSYMQPDRAALALQVMDAHLAAAILEREEAHVALPIVELMDENIRKTILVHLPSTTFADIVMAALPILSEHSIFMCKDSIENILRYCGANGNGYHRSCCGFVNILNQEECYCAQNTEQDILNQNLNTVLEYASMGCTVAIQHGNLCNSFSRASMLLNRLDAPQVAQFVEASISPYASAQVLNVLEEAHAASIMGSLDIPVAAAILDNSGSEFVASTILRTPVEKLPALMNEMNAGKIAQSLSLLSNSETSQILQLLPPEKAARVSDQINTYTPGAFTSSPETYIGNPESFAGRPEATYTPETYIGNPESFAGRPEAVYTPGVYAGNPESFAGRPMIDNHSCLSIIEEIDSSINAQLGSDSTQYLISGYIKGESGLHPLSLNGLSMFLELSQWVSGDSKSWYEASPQDFQVSCVGAAVYDSHDNSLQKDICSEMSYTMHPKYLQVTFGSVDVCPTCVLGGGNEELFVISHKDSLPLDFRPPVFSNWTCISGTENTFDRFAGGNMNYFDVEDPSFSKDALAQENNMGLQNSKFGSLPSSLNSQRIDELKQLPFESLRNAFPDLPSSTKGNLLSSLDNEAILILLQNESPEEIALLLTYLDTATAATALSNLDPRTVSDVLKKVSPTRTSDILAMMRPETIASIISVLPDDPWMAEKVLSSNNDTMMHALGNLVPAATTSEILAGMSKEDLESFFASMAPVEAMQFLLKLEKDVAAMVIQDLQSPLSGLVQSMDRNTIKETFGMSDPVVVALVIKVVPPESKVAVVSNVSPLQASFILQQLENEEILQILKEMPTEDVAAIIDAIDVELAPYLLELLPKEDSARILNVLPSRSALRLIQTFPLPMMKALAPLLDADKIDLVLQYLTPAEAAVVISTLDPATIENLNSRNPRLMDSIMQSLSEEDSQRIREALKLNKMIALVSETENCEPNQAAVLLRSKLDSTKQNYLIAGSIQNQGDQAMNLKGLAITIDLSPWHEDLQGNWQSDGALEYQVDCKYVLNTGEGTNNLCQNLIVEVISNSVIVTFKDTELCPSCSLTGGPDGILFEISRNGNTLDNSNMPVAPDEMICLSNLIQNMQGMDSSNIANKDGSCNVASALQSTIEFIPAENYTMYNLAGELTQTSPTTVTLDEVALTSPFNGWAQSSEHVWSQHSPEDFVVECVGIIMVDTRTNSSVDLCPFLQPYISREHFLLSFKSGVELCPTCVIRGLNSSTLLSLTHKENLVMDFAMDHQLLSPECYADIEDPETREMLNDNLQEMAPGGGNPDLASAASSSTPGTSGAPVVPIDYIDASQLSIALSNDSQRYDIGGSITQTSNEDGLLDMTITMEFSPWTRANGSTEWTSSPPDQFVVDCNKEAQQGNEQFCDQLQVSITPTNESVIAAIDFGNVMLCGDCSIGEPGSGAPLFSLRHVDGAMLDFRQPLIGYAPSVLLHQSLETDNDSWITTSPSGDEIHLPQNDTNT